MKMLTAEEVYNKAIETYGKEHQCMVAIEEMAELQKELCKNFRGRDNKLEIAEEIADVRIMLEQLTLIFDCRVNVYDFWNNKLERLERRLNGESEE